MSETDARALVWAQTEQLTMQVIALEQLLIAKGVLFPGELDKAVKLRWERAPKEKQRRFAAALAGAKRVILRAVGR